MSSKILTILTELLQNNYVQIGLFLVILFVIFSILKSLVKASVLAVIFFIFIKVLFLWTPQEFTENFKINTFFKEESANKINKFYEGFYEKRQSTSPINEDNLRKEMDRTEAAAKSSVEDIFNKITTKDDKNENKSKSINP